VLDPARVFVRIHNDATHIEGIQILYRLTLYILTIQILRLY